MLSFSKLQLGNHGAHKTLSGPRKCLSKYLKIDYDRAKKKKISMPISRGCPKLLENARICYVYDCEFNLRPGYSSLENYFRAHRFFKYPTGLTLGKSRNSDGNDIVNDILLLRGLGGTDFAK